MEKQISLFTHSPESKQRTTKPASSSIHIFSIYIDGAARGNPGPAGAGIYVTREHESVLKKGIFLGEKTNNQAEYLALALALFYVNNYIHQNNIASAQLAFFSDSELLIKQMRGEYKVKNTILAALKSYIDAQLSNHSVRFTHVMREKNKEADRLANVGIDKKHAPPALFIKKISDFGLLIS